MDSAFAEGSINKFLFTWYPFAPIEFSVTKIFPFHDEYALFPITPLKPGSATKPFFGIEIDVVDDNGKPVKTGEEGKLVIKSPWPGMARTIHKDSERYVEVYWKEYEKQE